ncbi:hypothetical protein D3C76_1637290 [compost metagenome]
MYLDRHGRSPIALPSMLSRFSKYRLPDHPRSMTICSNACRLSSLWGLKVRAKALRLKISPDCR